MNYLNDPNNKQNDIIIEYKGYGFNSCVDIIVSANPRAAINIISSALRGVAPFGNAALSTEQSSCESAQKRV